MPGSYIDDLAKSNLEHFQPEFNPEDWKAMDAMLESKKTGGAFYYSRRALLAAAAILLFITGGLMGYFIDKSITPDNNLTPANQPAVTIDNIEKGTLKELNNTAGTVAGSDKSEEQLFEQNEQIDNDKINIVPPAIPVIKNNTGKANKSDRNAAIAINTKEKKKNIRKEEKFGTGRSILEENNSTFFDMTSDISSDYLPFKELSANLGDLPETDLEKKLQEMKEKRRISASVGFMISPDVNIPDKSTAGFTSGITGELALGKKISLSTGLLFSKKKYKENSELNATANFIPEATSADFSLLEIPLMVRYNISTDNRLQPFITAGISGYFPLKEEYDITYKQLVVDTSGGNYLPLSYYQDNSTFLVAESYNSTLEMTAGTRLESMSNEKTINNYHLKPYLGFLNLSAGVEYRLSPAISFQIAPQVKLPMTGMGLEEKMVTTISLHSSVKYHFGN